MNLVLKRKKLVLNSYPVLNHTEFTTKDSMTLIAVNTGKKFKTHVIFFKSKSIL